MFILFNIFVFNLHIIFGYDFTDIFLMILSTMNITPFWYGHLETKSFVISLTCMYKLVINGTKSFGEGPAVFKVTGS